MGFKGLGVWGSRFEGLGLQYVGFRGVKRCFSHEVLGFGCIGVWAVGLRVIVALALRARKALGFRGFRSSGLRVEDLVVFQKRGTPI